jgi:hypothetical protein
VTVCACVWIHHSYLPVTAENRYFDFPNFLYISPSPSPLSSHGIKVSEILHLCNNSHLQACVYPTRSMDYKYTNLRKYTVQSSFHLIVKHNPVWNVSAHALLTSLLIFYCNRFNARPDIFCITLCRSVSPYIRLPVNTPRPVHSVTFPIYPSNTFVLMLCNLSIVHSVIN